MSRHFVSDKPFDPYSVENLTAEQEHYYFASQWRLMWWKLKRHKLAMVSSLILLLIYFSALFCGFLSPYNLHSRHIDFIYAPPQQIHFFHENQFVGPFVYGLEYRLNMENLKREYKSNTNDIQKLRFFCKGDQYKFWELVNTERHLVCAAKEGQFFLLGTDRLGRDMYSRILYGARISLTIGLIGVIVSFTLGIIIGGIAGYYGGMIDHIVQRLIEILRSFPELPLWMALSAILPVTWNPLSIFFGITIILAMLDWTSLARAVRSKLLALREEDYCSAAQLMGAKPKRIISKHLLPGFMSHLIASASLSIPAMILGETALSFLGLGLRPPITSWGVLLNEAQNINVVALYPWLMLPVIPVIIVILGFNFLGDGLRDAADPYK